MAELKHNFLEEQKMLSALSSQVYWTDHYNTPLQALDQLKFVRWMDSQSIKRGRDISQDLVNYDLQGYWKNEGSKDKGIGHMPDTYKKPNHPSFSDESKYSGTEDPWGGRFQGGRWIGDDAMGWSYQPSERMLKTTHTHEQLQGYFADNEPDVGLVMPPVDVK